MYINRFPLFLAALLITVSAGASAADLPADANTTCPVMTAEASDPEVFVDHEGKRVFLCCNKCKKSFNKDPKKYLDLIAKSSKETTGTASSPKSTAIGK